MNMINSIPAILILLILCAGGYHLFSLYCAWEFFRKERSETALPPHIPVSIIKPLKGIEPEFAENLRTFCEQDYPEYEIVLGFSDSADDAIPRVKEMVDSLTDCNVRTVIGTDRPRVNPKVSNLEGLAESARHPMLAISDSDMRVDRSYLGRCMEEYFSDRNVGLVTSLYKISKPESIGAALESLTIALDFIPSVLVARRLEGVTFGLGASLVLSKKALEEIGGFAAVGDYLADDYQLGNRLWKRGYSIVLSRYVIENVAGPMSIADFWRHQLRWARTYRASRPKGFAGYGITHMVPFSLLLLITEGPTALSLSVLGSAVMVRYGLAYVLQRKVIHSRQWLKWLVLVPIKDILGFGIWAWSFTSRKVRWRGNEYRIIKDGKLRQTE
ncbi:MAG TPA: bacteriohopanetetrol glucosamine biosynthesis glycosyltransferase HpnI [Nitrospirota bacterium]|nr:bacteriohopanetetrol glucosamine biosynthesis glycosyltransferase HpnI [Nitrospirota bacterium]